MTRKPASTTALRAAAAATFGCDDLFKRAIPQDGRRSTRRRGPGSTHWCAEQPAALAQASTAAPAMASAPRWPNTSPHTRPGEPVGGRQRLGTVLPAWWPASLLAILLPPANVRVGVCVATVLLGLAGTGYLAARVGSSSTGRRRCATCLVGGLTMAMTYGLGTAAHTLL